MLNKSVATQIHFSHSKLPPELGLSWYRQLQMVKRDFLGYLTFAANLYRGRASFVTLRPVPWMNVALVNDLEVAGQILGAKASCFTKSHQTRKMVGKFLGEGLIVSEGDVNRSERRSVALGLHKYSSREFIEPLAKRTLKDLETGKSYEINSLFHDLGFKMIVQTLFNVDMQGKQTAIGSAMSAFAEAMSTRFMSIPLPEWMPTKRHLRENWAVREVARCLHDIERELDPRSLASALRVQFPDFQKWSDQIVSLLFAGHETVAKWLSWSALRLGSSKEALSACRDDLRAGSSKVLEAFMEEVLRFYPPVWVFDRTPREDIEIAGYLLKGGQVIYISPYTLQRDERYFRDSDKFVWDRFCHGNNGAESAKILAFGFGARHCVGERFARIQAVTILSEIIKNFDFIWEMDVSDIVPKGLATLGMSKPLRFTFQPVVEKRETAHASI